MYNSGEEEDEQNNNDNNDNNNSIKLRSGMHGQHTSLFICISELNYFSISFYNIIKNTWKKIPRIKIGFKSTSCFQH